MPGITQPLSWLPDSCWDTGPEALLPMAETLDLQAVLETVKVWGNPQGFWDRHEQGLHNCAFYNDGLPLASYSGSVAFPLRPGGLG